MKLGRFQPGSIDWTKEAVSVLPGESGDAAQRTRILGDAQLRIVDYGAGYIADHWCAKGHILYVVSGAVTIEHSDGTRYELAGGMSWHAAEDEGAPHRVVTPGGARVFIVD